jgi:hypothetical protein
MMNTGNASAILQARARRRTPVLASECWMLCCDVLSGVVLFLLQD